jgi:hypothetical protein
MFSKGGGFRRPFLALLQFCNAEEEFDSHCALGIVRAFRL